LAAGILVLLGTTTSSPTPHPEPGGTDASTAAAPDGTAPAGDGAPAERVQHLARAGIDRWHAAGYRGQGVKVTVLDSGFQGYRAHLGKALPARVTTRSFRADGRMEAKDSQHGILCGEVVHALAPSAELLFANWDTNQPECFLDAVRWARRQGARVVSCSIIMPSWSDGEGNGPVHEALRQALGPGDQPGDLLCFACAGNTAQRHWGGPFHGGGDGFHRWQAGERDNRLTPWGDDRVSVELCCPPGAVYELGVRDETAGTDAGCARVPAAEGRPCAVVHFHPRTGHDYRVRVRHLGGRAAPFHVVALGGGLQYATARGSIPFPGDGPEVIAVGAVDGSGGRVPYSSCGPNSARPKPDLVAVVPFPSLCRPRPFSGTSAAAPQAAALAALWWSRHSDWTANQVREALRAACRDLGPPGHDWETGHGLVRLP
jgi:subtilisin family serine protease